ncbi:MAG TPA: alpha/beta hydrolase [Rhizomicrobium sp.]|nr:alpha/beta hydrolase [Rhizomicrobium sp.]
MKAFLDQMALVPGPKMFELPPDQGRAMFVAMMQMFGPKDVPVGGVKNLSVGDIAMRMYTPVASGGAALPTLIYFHGGGFVIGDLETHDGLCRQFANEGGFAVIAVDYRRAPEHKFPAALDDAIAAVEWVETHASELGVDANRIAVGGDSAGGALAAAVAQHAKAEGAPKIAFQMLLFPVTQIGGETSSLREFAVGYFLDKATLDWFYKQYVPEGQDKSDPRVSPLNAVDFKGLPPAYVMLGGFDPLHDEGMQYAKKLRDAGVAVEIADYPGLVHCFIYMQAVLPQAHEAVSTAAKAVAKGLGVK